MVKVGIKKIMNEMKGILTEVFYLRRRDEEEKEDEGDESTPNQKVIK